MRLHIAQILFNVEKRRFEVVQELCHICSCYFLKLAGYLNGLLGFYGQHSIEVSDNAINAYE